MLNRKLNLKSLLDPISEGEYFETDQLVRALKPAQKALALNTVEVLMGNGFIEPMEKYAV